MLPTYLPTYLPNFLPTYLQRDDIAVRLSELVLNLKEGCPTTCCADELRRLELAQ